MFGFWIIYIYEHSSTVRIHLGCEMPKCQDSIFKMKIDKTFVTKSVCGVSVLCRYVFIQLISILRTTSWIVSGFAELYEREELQSLEEFSIEVLLY